MRLVRQADMERLRVVVGIDGDGADAQICGGTRDPYRDLAAIGDQDTLERHQAQSVDSEPRTVPRRVPY